MKRALALALALLMCLSAAPAMAIELERGLPYNADPRIVPEGEQVTLTLFQSLSDKVDALNSDKNSFTKLLEDATGLTLNFAVAPQSDSRTKLNVLLNSGDYPDIISSRAYPRTEMAMYAEQGVFIALDDYLTEALAPNTLDVFEAYPPARVVCTGSDGKVYSLPDVNDCYHCMYGNGRAWYYMPWMRSINNDVYPETTDELMTYLKYIRDNDVNGNGDPNDEIPVAFVKDDADSFIRWIASSFMIYPKDHYRLEDDGTITACFTEDAYKQALAFAHEMYAEGLILEESFSIAINDLNNIGEDPSGNKFGLIVGWGPERGVVRNGETKRWFEYFALPPVAGPDGARYHNYTGSWGSVGTGYFITDKCRNVEYAVQLGDLLLSYFYGYSSLYGTKGIGWDDPSSEDAVDFNGNPAMYRELVQGASQPMNTSWNQVNIMYRNVDWWMAREAEGAVTIRAYLDGDFTLRDEAAAYPSYNEVMKYYACNKNLDPYKFDDKYIVPPLLYDDETADIVADANTLVEAYRREMMAAFVIGSRDLSEYDAYVQELNDMGLQDILSSMTKAYDTFISQ